MGLVTTIKVLREGTTSVLGHKYQVDVKIRYLKLACCVFEGPVSSVVIHAYGTMWRVDKSPASMASKRKRHPRNRQRNTPTHVINQALRPTLAHLATVNKRLDAGRRVYNACVGESLARCKAMRADPTFNAAKALPKGPRKSKESAARKKTFNEVAVTHGFSADAMRTYSSSLRKTWVREHVGAQEAQRLATRAFDAVNRWSLGKGGKPRFKNASRGLRSLECSDKYGDIQPVLDNGHLIAVRWSKMVIPVEPLPKHPTKRHDREVAAERGRLESLIASGGLIQTRIVRNMIRGRPSLCAQCVVDGCSPIRHETGTGTISADVGPSIMSVVVADAEHNPVSKAIGHRVLTEGIKDIQAELRRLQRHLDRQHRAGSPQCFNEMGQHKKTCAWWKNRTKAAQQTLVQIAELHRRIAATRSTSHGKLVNKLLAYGVNVRSEALNYATWQKMYPRSVRDSSVGEAMALLFHKAENAGGKAYRYTTRTTALSQICVCGHREKKPLSQRWHRCSNCGRRAQQDLFSAFLGLYVDPVVGADGANKDTCDLEGAASMWPAFAPHLQEAGGMARSSGTPKHRGRPRRSRRSAARITARHTRRSRGATEVFCGIPVPDQATTATSVAA
ncbi:MAG: nuclease/transposase family protein [Acidimicrobiales bacterium]